MTWSWLGASDYEAMVSHDCSDGTSTCYQEAFITNRYFSVLAIDCELVSSLSFIWYSLESLLL
jgi:hypothetical protein